MLQPKFYFFIFSTKLFWDRSLATVRIVHKDCPLDCPLNAQSGCVMVSFGLFIKRRMNCSCLLFTDDLFWNDCYNQTFIFFIFPNKLFWDRSLAIIRIVHKDSSLDCSLNAQSGCVMVSFGLFIKRMIEPLVFTFYRWSILKWML